MENKNEELLLDSSNFRYSIFPIEYKDIWASYQQQLASFWVPKEIDFSKDRYDYNTLDDTVKNFIDHILAFFAVSDTLVNLNIDKNLINKIKIHEAIIAYEFQKTMENIHKETYALAIDNIISNEDKKKKLFDAVATMPVINKIVNWGMKYMEIEDLATNIIAFSIFEGVFFSGAFASIFWIKRYLTKGKQFLKGFIQSNDFISRDEASHVQFACLLYSYVKNRLSEEKVYEMFDEATSISQEFIIEMISCEMIGMNRKDMSNYIEYIADTLLVSLNYKKRYNKSNPFTFMDTIGLQTKTSFFETRATEYQLVGNEDRELSMIENF